MRYLEDSEFVFVFLLVYGQFLGCEMKEEVKRCFLR